MTIRSYVANVTVRTYDVGERGKRSVKEMLPNSIITIRWLSWIFSWFRKGLRVHGYQTVARNSTDNLHVYNAQVENVENMRIYKTWLGQEILSHAARSVYQKDYVVNEILSPWMTFKILTPYNWLSLHYASSAE